MPIFTKIGKWLAEPFIWVKNKVLSFIDTKREEKIEKVVDNIIDVTKASNERMVTFLDNALPTTEETAKSKLKILGFGSSILLSILGLLITKGLFLPLLFLWFGYQVTKQKLSKITTNE